MVLAWGLNFSVVKIANHSFSPSVVGLLRFLLMCPILLGLALAFTRTLRPPKGMAWKLASAGAVSSGLYMILFLEGMARTGAAQGAIALATAPMFTALFSILAGYDRFRWALVAGSLIAFAGVALVLWASPADKTGTLLGTGLVLLSAVVWAWGVVLMKPVLHEMDALSATALSMPAAIVFLLPYGAAGLVQMDWSRVTVEGWWALVYLVLIAGCAAFLAYYKALSDIGPARATMVQFLIPPTAAVGAYFLLDSHFHPLQGVGLAVALAGVYVGLRRPSKQEDQTQDAVGTG